MIEIMIIQMLVDYFFFSRLYSLCLIQRSILDKIEGLFYCFYEQSKDYLARYSLHRNSKRSTQSFHREEKKELKLHNR
jgi:hypothetical protein